MYKLSLSLLISSLALTGCANATDPDSGDAEIGGAPKQLEVGALDKIATAKSTDPRLLNCQLEYEALTPTFAVKTAASFETTFGQVENTGAFAADATYQLAVTTNPNPPYNLSFIIEIVDLAKGAGISYIVLPRPHVGGAFLFELGAPIAPATFDATTYDHMRAYCSIRMP
jgi:hypothetical protein